MRRELARVGGLVLVLLVGVVGCSAPPGEVDPWGLGVTLDAVSGFQRDLLADGELTFAEMERSVMATVECVREAGVQVSDPEFDGYMFRFHMGFAETEAELDSVDDVYAACYSEFQEVVDAVWAVVHTPSAADERQYIDRIARCLAGFDITLDGDATVIDAMTAVEDNFDVAHACWRPWP